MFPWPDLASCTQTGITRKSRLPFVGRKRIELLILSINMVRLILIQPPTKPWFMISMVFFSQTWLWITRPWPPLFKLVQLGAVPNTITSTSPYCQLVQYIWVEYTFGFILSQAWKKTIDTFKIISPLDVKDSLTINSKSFLGNQK